MSSQGTHRGVLRAFAGRRALRRTAIVAVLTSVASGGLFAAGLTGADAFEVNTTTAPTGAANGATTSLTTPSGLTTTVTSTGNTVVNDVGSSIGATSGSSSGLFTPQLPSGTATMRMNVGGQVGAVVACAVGATCAEGTMTVTFSQPVTNPVLHIYGLGGVRINGAQATRSTAILTLASSSPTGASLGGPNAAATNLTSTGGTAGVIRATNANASTACNTLADATPNAAALAGCGSIQVTSTVTSLTFNASLTSVAVNGSTLNPATDAFGLDFTFGQDYGDAPASYDVGNAAYNDVGDLHLGAAEDAENATVANSTTDPNAVAAGANANGTNGDGTDEDAFTTLPDPVGGSTYTRTVPISGASKAGIVCGWIDFDRGGTFNTTTEQACGSFAAGATSVALTWTVPATASAGLSYARFRDEYGATTPTPTGGESSGEVEDYSLTIDGAPLSCSAIYGSYSAGTINAINPTTGAGVAAATIPGGSLNGIGITVGGTNIYGVTGGASTAGTWSRSRATTPLPRPSRPIPVRRS